MDEYNEQDLRFESESEMEEDLELFAKQSKEN